MPHDRDHALLRDRPHRRLNALTGEWMFVSPHRDARPWRGRHEKAGVLGVPAYDPQCHLCPGNVRAQGERNAAYTSTYVFPNDFPAFLSSGASQDASVNPLMRAHLQSGTCKVMCYSPRHDLGLAQLPVPQIRAVVDAWAEQVEDLEMRWPWVQVFENKGELMGCSNPHPHAQLWASDFIPNEVAKELDRQRRWFDGSGTSLLLDYAQLETSADERVVLRNPDWIAVVPWWAVWPFETLLLPLRPVVRLPDLMPGERQSLAQLLGRLLAVYDHLFEAPFPYSFGWHGAPASGGSPLDRRAWQLHAHFYPPLLRSATIKKFMVGYELLAEAQRDSTPELSARRLRELARRLPFPA